MEEVWGGAEVIAYGRITALQLAPAADRKNAYLAVLRVERCWKGQIKEEIVIQETMPDGAGMGCLLEFNQTYILQLAKSATGKTYTQHGVQKVSLPINKNPQPPALSSAFGNIPSEIPFVTWVEFLERKVGNLEEANRIRQLRGQESLDRETRESKGKIFADKAVADYRSAMKEMGIAERKALLEALLTRIEYNTEEEMVALAAKIKAEISLASTFQANGINTFP